MADEMRSLMSRPPISNFFIFFTSASILRFVLAFVLIAYLSCSFAVDACEKQQKHGRQMAADALMAMPSPSNTIDSKIYLESLLQRQPMLPFTHQPGKSQCLFYLHFFTKFIVKRVFRM